MRVYEGQIRTALVSLSIGTGHELVGIVRHLLIVTAAATIAVIGSAGAQVVTPPVAAQSSWPPAAYSVQRYPFPGTAPEDAYRNGLINRWELEQYQGPTPPALQGPSPNGGNQVGGM